LADTREKRERSISPEFFLIFLFQSKHKRLFIARRGVIASALSDLHHGHAVDELDPQLVDQQIVDYKNDPGNG